MLNRNRYLESRLSFTKATRLGLAGVFLVCSLAVAQDRAGPLRFRVRLAPELGIGAQSGRLIVFLSSDKELQQELKREPGASLHSMWMAAEEIRGWRPGEVFNFDPDRLAWPTALSQAPPADYQVMAVLDVNHHYAFNGLNPGDLRSEVQQVQSLEPRRTLPVELSLTKRVEPAQINLPPGIELLDFQSPLLTRFWERPIHMRGVVVLPPSYARTKQYYATAYYVLGFAADMVNITQLAPAIPAKGMADGVFPEMIHVALDESCPSGTHEFADSVNNGPWGQALTQELIPLS